MIFGSIFDWFLVIMSKIVIGVFGKINSGKSCLVNSLAKEEISIVSNVRGSTSDSVFKMTEIDGIGIVKLVDTAGYDDDGVLCKQRLLSVQKSFDSSDIAIIVTKDNMQPIDEDWIQKCKASSKKYLVCHNIEGVKKVEFDEDKVILDVKNSEHVNLLTQKIKQLLGDKKNDILGELVQNGELVLLCVPQDDGAPTDRLILPQSIVIKSIVDKGATPIVCNGENFLQMYEKFKKDISLVITDSSVFDMVYKVVGGFVPITSFSVLFAKANGDIKTFACGANCLDELEHNDKVLIMESCSHTLSHKDIGSVLIPNLIKKYTNKNIIFDFARGKDEPANWKDYKLVIHCGGCMQNREFIMSRVNKCIQNGVCITNYGVIIAKIKGILDKIVY